MRHWEGRKHTICSQYRETLGSKTAQYEEEKKPSPDTPIRKERKKEIPLPRYSLMPQVTSLTFQNLRQLEWSLRRAGPAPDPVTAFVIQQQALHEKDDAWRPHISDNSGEMWGTNHIVQPYEEQRQKRQHRAQEDVDLQSMYGYLSHHHHRHFIGANLLTSSGR